MQRCRLDSASLPSSHLALSAELEALSSVVTILRHRQERLGALLRSQAHCLPDDILLPIFAQLVPTSVESGTQSLHRLTSGAFAFSRVCRNWRSLALATPGLWNQPLLYNADLAQAMLDRSVNVPLMVVMNLRSGRRSSTVSAVRAVLACIDRISYLAVAATSSLALEYGLPFALRGPAPILTELKLSSHTSDLTMEALADAFVKSAPQLSRLSLYRVKAPWNSELMGRLCVLSVTRDDNSEPRTATSLNELLLALRDMPAMEYLNLQLAADERTLEDPLLDEPISLPYLRQLSIWDDMRVSAVILQRIIAPCLAQLAIRDDLSRQKGSGREKVVVIVCMGLPGSATARMLASCKYT
jgi:hypothetical protein